MHDVAKLLAEPRWRTNRAALRVRTQIRICRRRLITPVVTGLAVVFLYTSFAYAQTVPEHIAQGDRESTARHPALALPYYERALALDSNSFASLWKASRELVDLGEASANESNSRDYYRRAAALAARAVAIRPNDAEGHFHLARATGRTALSISPRERVKYALEVRKEALRALELDPRHPGALHIMGVWNAEVMRLNGFTKFIAKKFMGGQVMDSASWPVAIAYMEEAVAYDPARLVHRLDLARVYRDSGRKADARLAYQAALAATFLDANDDMYRRDAERELAALIK